MDQPEFLGVTNDTWDAITAIATAGTLLIAAVAAAVAVRQLRHSSQTWLEQNRPYVLVTFDQSPVDVTFADILIRNVGAGLARNVTIKVDPPLERSTPMPHADIAAAPYFNETIPMLPPGYELRTFYDSMYERRDRDDLPSRHTFTVSYEDGQGRRFEEASDQDLSMMRGLVFTERYGIHHAAKALVAIEQHLKRSPLMAGQVDATVESREDWQARERATAERHRERLAHYERRAAEQRTAGAASPSDDGEPDVG